MEVILRQAVDNLGHPGDVVTVSAGYARNYLLPRGIAYAATEGNKKRISQEKARLEAAENERRGAAEELAKRVEEVSITFSARVGEEGKLFGSVTTADIAQQLEAQGFSVEKLGHPGDIVKVSPGFARNYLLPRGIAYEATPGNRKRIAQEKSRLEAAESTRRNAAQELAAKLEEVSLTFSARVGEENKLFGSVTGADIAQQLEAQGFHIEKRQIELHDPIRALGVYRVPVKLHADVKPEIKVWVIKQ